jgi:hypothetical protein
LTHFSLLSKTSGAKHEVHFVVLSDLQVWQPSQGLQISPAVKAKPLLQVEHFPLASQIKQSGSHFTVETVYSKTF